jgi:hypothetical protein
MTIFNAAFAFVLASAVASAAAQPIYRCGNAYSQVACLQGELIDAADPRSEAQRAEAVRVAAEDRRLAAQMQRDRLAEEAALAPKVVLAKGRAARPVGLSDVSAARPPKKSKNRQARSTQLMDPMIVAPAAPKRRARV